MFIQTIKFPSARLTSVKMPFGFYGLVGRKSKPHRIASSHYRRLLNDRRRFTFFSQVKHCRRERERERHGHSPTKKGSLDRAPNRIFVIRFSSLTHASTVFHIDPCINTEVTRVVGRDAGNTPNAVGNFFFIYIFRPFA